MKSRKVLVIGAGRMGISHGSMIGLLDPHCEIIFIEPSFKSRIVLRLISGRRVVVRSKLNRVLVKDASHAVIASPPTFHQKNYDELISLNFTGRLLIEKPVATVIHSSSMHGYVMSGYVLQHSVFWRKLLSEVRNRTIHKINISLETNQVFANTSSNWRNSLHNPSISFLSEFGSHCLNLLNTLDPNSNIKIKTARADYIEILNEGKIASKIVLKSASAHVRKSVYKVEVVLHDRTICTDFYSYVSNIENKIYRSETLASKGETVPAYLRGQEFSNQAAYFLGDGAETYYSADFGEIVDKQIERLEEGIRCLS